VGVFSWENCCWAAAAVIPVYVCDVSCISMTVLTLERLARLFGVLGNVGWTSRRASFYPRCFTEKFSL